MPSYQKISRKGDILTFRIICDEMEKGVPAHVEEQAYLLGAKGFEGESEDELMSRVAHHINDGIALRAEPEEKKLFVEEPIVVAIPKEDLPYVEEAVVEEETT